MGSLAQALRTAAKWELPRVVLKDGPFGHLLPAWADLIEMGILEGDVICEEGIDGIQGVSLIKIKAPVDLTVHLLEKQMNTPDVMSLLKSRDEPFEPSEEIGTGIRLRRPGEPRKPSPAATPRTEPDKPRSGKTN